MAYSKMICCLFLLHLLSSCTQKCDDTDLYEFIQKNTMAGIPYTGDDILELMHVLNGDTIFYRLEGLGVEHGFHKELKVNPCGGEREKLYEYFKYSYASEDGWLNIDIEVTAKSFNPDATRAIIFTSPTLSTSFYLHALENNSIALGEYERVSLVSFEGNRYPYVLIVDHSEKSTSDFTPNIRLYYNELSGFIRIENKTTGEIYQLI